MSIRQYTTFAGQLREPEFAEQVPNITVAVGREAVLPCVVDHLGTFKVAWIKVDTQTIYTIHTRVISHNPRIASSHNGHRIWNLHIRNVQEEDRGFYMCQINTSPMKNQVGYITVVVPPDIIYEQSSSDITVTEGGNASLYCKATGCPQPNITWRREDGRPIRTNIKERSKVSTMDGEVLNFTKVTRKHMGAYLCIASNGILPAISKRIFLQVNFKPKVKVVNQILGALVGNDATLDCQIEASPKPVNIWRNENGDVLISSSKYQILEKIDSYDIQLSLRIRNVESKDFGTYNCSAKNILGESESSIQLIEILVPTTKSEWITKETTIQITGQTEEPFSHNRPLASQTAFPFINSIDNVKPSEKKLEVSKGTSGNQRKQEKVTEPLGDRSHGRRTDSNTNCGKEIEFSALLSLMIWYKLLHFANVEI